MFSSSRLPLFLIPMVISMHKFRPIGLYLQVAINAHFCAVTIGQYRAIPGQIVLGQNGQLVIWALGLTSSIRLKWGKMVTLVLDLQENQAIGFSWVLI